jgi:hypothetical protein
MRSKTARSGCDFTVSGFQELFNVRADRDCESLHVVDRNVAFAALNGTDVGAVQPGFFSQIFLGNSQYFPLASQVLTKDLPDVSLAAHEFMLDNVMPLRLQT